MSIFLERMVLPALVTILVAFSLTNPFDLRWQVRIGASLAILAIGLAISYSLHWQQKRTGSATVRAAAPTVAPRLATTPTTPLETAVPSPARPTGSSSQATAPSPADPKSDERIFIGGPPEYFLRLGDGLMTSQRTLLIQPYLGKWMRVEGAVYDVAIHEYTSTISLASSKGLLTHVLSFDPKKWNEYLLVLSKGSTVNVIGQFDSIFLDTIRLRNCELYYSSPQDLMTKYRTVLA